MQWSRNVVRVWFLLSLFLAITSFTTFAQQNSEINGTVTDPNGAALANVQVTLTSTSTGTELTTQTNSSGVYSFPGLNVGTYDLKATAAGFQTYLRKGVVVNVSQTVRADITLQVGSVQETVTVQANALQVQADSNVVSTLINADQISEIATENRNFAALAALGLGVSSALPDNNTPTSVAANFTISVNGLRQSHNIWLIDGGEADDRGGAGGMDIMPSQNAIAEFQVLASNYPPDYGISSGATITLGLKSGSRNFHGQLWEFNRNTAYNANNWFNNQSGQPRTKLNYNIFGFNVGGPLMIPGVYNTDRQKTFFFVNEEWRKLIQGSSPNSVQTLPAQDFPTAGQDLHYVPPAFAPNTQLLVPKVQDPAYNTKLASLGLTPGQPFPNNTIPASLFDPNAVLYLNSGIIPKPNLSNGNVVTSANQPIDVRDDVVRIDHNINDKWHLLGHFMHDAVSQAYSAPMLGWSGASYNTITSTLSNPSYSATIKLAGSISPNLLLEVSMNYDGNIINIVNSNNSYTPSGWSVNRYFNNTSKNLPNMHWGAPYNTQENPGSAPWHNAAQDFMPRVDISYTVGTHSFKFGASYNRYTKNQQLFGQPGGEFYFGTLTNDSMMDMLLGLASSYDQHQALPIRHYVNQTPSVYLNDNWRATPRLSLQLGFRYDALPHAWERQNYIANFDPYQYLQSQAPQWLSDGSMNPNGPGFQNVNGTPFYLNGMYIAGQNGYPRGVVNNDYATLQPRVGFSWDLMGTGRTVLRGGLGTFYERMQGNDIYNTATNPPFANDPSASNVYLSDPHTSWVTGQTATTPFFAQGLTTLARSYPAPAVAQFSLGVQHEVVPSVIWVVQYVGNLAWHQNVDRQINNFPLDTSLSVRANAGDPSNHSGTNPGGTSLANINIYRTYQGYTGINQQENTTNGNYNGFQTGIRAQNKHGLSGELDYTWSHEIDITSYDLNGVSNPWNLKYDKGSGALDRRHILNANYIYKLPFFEQGNGLTHSLLGGWEIAGTAVFESGVIIQNQGPNLSINFDPIGLGGGYTNRPNFSGKMHYLKKATQWFDTTPFSTPTPAWAGGTNQGFGNARKDVALGPGRTNFTTSLYKTFTFTERASLQMRFESFNTFNHTEFNNVGGSYGSGNFGQPTNTWDPRVLELGAVLNF
ncbi:MAG: carboxypeptidase-like regulatory domain-containing protein [Bacillota bacterium]|nr:carboxypeptidase-like regulatory domain-containing protein [Bacillota bacterium]